MKRLLTVEEAAEYTGFSVRYLRRLIFERRLAFHKDRRRVWLAPTDLDAYVKSLRVEARDGLAPPTTRTELRVSARRGSGSAHPPAQDRSAGGRRASRC